VQTILDNFSKHAEDVNRLITFDEHLMGLVIASVERLHNQLKNNQHIQNEQINGARELLMLKNIRENESLKPRYSLILNQAIVLLVSYFGSAVEDIFSESVIKTLRNNSSSQLRKEDMKLSVGELLELAENPNDSSIATLFVDKKDLSFQDMQAISRAFKEYISVEIAKNTTVNNIILAQACRHVIVHAGGEITNRLIKQVSGAKPRDIKEEIKEGEIVQFSHQEVQEITDSMKDYLSKLVANTQKVLASNN
jgi:hypothetical protein